MHFLYWLVHLESLFLLVSDFPVQVPLIPLSTEEQYIKLSLNFYMTDFFGEGGGVCVCVCVYVSV